ncbi:uncharacterized protein LOC127086972 [Lathyrus oleraceus]|uniref:uncharacterized protein LOC127086972 n=1 Tax=Pisum sativum TaxID=3888 RepID=UPI0021CDEDB3|nr:uncharacterized protein LOC127086972 [Pisum sativum]
MAKECSTIIQRKLPPKLTNQDRFTIPYSIGSLIIGHALYDLGANINLIPLSMMRKIKYGDPKSTQMTLTLGDISITYLYRVLEDVLVRVYDLLFLEDFIILDILEDSETPLILDWSFLATCRALINVEFGELILRFNQEKVVFIVFKAIIKRILSATELM